MTLVEFLRARLAEDGREAQDDWSEVYPTRTSRARLLAECEAKRRIVELHRLTEASGTVRPPGCEVCTEDFSWGPEVMPGPCLTLRLLALPFADHPDYDPTWKPT